MVRSPEAACEGRWARIIVSTAGLYPQRAGGASALAYSILPTSAPRVAHPAPESLLAIEHARYNMPRIARIQLPTRRHEPLTRPTQTIHHDDRTNRIAQHHDRGVGTRSQERGDVGEDERSRGVDHDGGFVVDNCDGGGGGDGEFEGVDEGLEAAVEGFGAAAGGGDLVVGLVMWSVMIGSDGVGWVDVRCADQQGRGALFDVVRAVE